MDLTLHISGETEQMLRQQSMLTGKDVASLALEALQEKLIAAEQDEEPLSTEARVKAFREWIAAMPHGNVDADLSRDSIYGDRGR